MSYLIQKHSDGETVPMTLLRDGEEVEIDVRLRRGERWFAKNLGFAYPQYIIVGPLAFTPVTANSISQLRGSKQMTDYLISRRNAMLSQGFLRRTAENKDLEMVTAGRNFLPHPITKGYAEPGFGVVKNFNDIEVKNLKHLVELMRDSKEEYFVFEFAGKGHETYVFEREEFLAATPTGSNQK